MTNTEFNKKYSDHIPKNYGGLSINIPEVVRYLDEEMPKVLKVNPTFKLCDVKYERGYIYVFSFVEKEPYISISEKWEEDITNILKKINKL